MGSIIGALKGRGGINFRDLGRLRQIYDPLLGLSESGSAAFISDAFNRLGQNTFLTPEQMSKFIAQLSAPGIANLQEQFGIQSRGLSSQFANRGQLFGGSLTGAQAQLGAGFGRGLSDFLSGITNQVGQLDLQLGAQRQLAAQQALNSILQQLLGGEFQLPFAARRG